jgi:hypothetical protein
LVQVHLIAQGRTKGCKGTSGIIPGPLEPPVDDGLKTSSQYLQLGMLRERESTFYRAGECHFAVVYRVLLPALIV